MPVYEFRCPGCGPFDLQRSMHVDSDAASCPTCARAAPRSYAIGGAVGLTLTQLLYVHGYLGSEPERDALDV